MILGLEIGLLIFGLVALVRGKFTLSKSKVVEGAAARLLGLLALTPLPLALAVVFLYVAASAPGNPEKFAEDNKLTIALIEAGVVIGIAVLVFGIGAALGKDPAEARRRKKKRRDEDDDDEEDYDQPRRRSRRDEEDDENEDDRPRRRSRRDDDDEDEDRPRRYR